MRLTLVRIFSSVVFILSSAFAQVPAAPAGPAVAAAGATRGSLRGVLLPAHDLQLSSRATGVIEKFGAEEGQPIKPGDLLVQLNSDIERAEVARAEAILESTNAEWEHTRRELERKTELRKDAIGSEKEFEDSRYAHQIATARRKQAQADLDASQARFKERSIFAPIPGLLFKRSRAVGEAVERLETVVRVIDASKLILVVYAGPELLGKFAVDTTARISIDTGPARGTQVEARVAFIDPVLDPESGTFRIRLQVDPTDKIQPGISVTLQVATEN